MNPGPKIEDLSFAQLELLLRRGRWRARAHPKLDRRQRQVSNIYRREFNRRPSKAGVALKAFRAQLRKTLKADKSKRKP